MAAPFQLLNFPMPKRDWTPEDIAMIARLLRAKVPAVTIAGQFEKATISDIVEIARLMGFYVARKPKPVLLGESSDAK